jgi:hypothetical protein
MLSKHNHIISLLFLFKAPLLKDESNATGSLSLVSILQRELLTEIVAAMRRNSSVWASVVHVARGLDASGDSRGEPRVTEIQTNYCRFLAV